MGIIPSKSLGEIASDSPVGPMLSSLSLEQAINKYKNFARKTAYYVGPSDNDAVVFGLEGNAHLIRISKDIYESIGRPEEGKDVPVSLILEKAGYNL